MKLKNVLRAGIWPFTPDPQMEGLYQFGAPPENAPILITSNSRYTLAQLRRILSPIGARVLAIDTGGMDVHSALATGSWSLEKITEALKMMNREKNAVHQHEPGMPAMAEHERPIVILPYPVWKAIGGGEAGDIAGIQLIAGPADARHLPAFFARGCQLAEGMKVLNLSFQDRLELSLAHAGVYCLVSALPLLAFGWQELVAGAAIALIGAVLYAALFRLLPGTNFWLKRVPLIVVLPILGIVLGATLGLSQPAFLYLVLAAFVGTGWITANIHPR